VVHQSASVVTDGEVKQPGDWAWVSPCGIESQTSN
jgi:hypothetical protein